MAEYEPWAVAYARILAEVEAEMPYATTKEVVRAFRRRAAEWKRERGIALSPRDVRALAED